MGKVEIKLYNLTGLSILLSHIDGGGKEKKAILEPYKEMELKNPLIIAINGAYTGGLHADQEKEE